MSGEERLDDLEASLQEIRNDLREIQQRNRIAERDKAWEVSWTRRALITVFTYVAMVVYFFAAGLPRPYVNSVVPAVAFVLATMSLPLFKPYWDRYIYDREKHRPH